MFRCLSLAFIASLACIACSGESGKPHSGRSASGEPRTEGEVRERIKPRLGRSTTLRTGPNVPISLPRGFTLYPGARIVTNTVVEHGKSQRTLLVFETADPIEKVAAFYRNQARQAGIRTALDIGGREAASLGGPMPSGGKFSFAARGGPITRAELSFE